MAAPHVAGAIALMLQVDKTLTSRKITEFLQASATRPSGGDKNAWGAGTIDVAKAIELVKAAMAPAPGPAPKPRSRGVPSVSGTPTRARRPSTARGPAAPAFPAIVEAMRGRVHEVPNGELCVGLVSKHFSEVRRLVNTIPKVATLWHRADGPAMLRRLARGAVDAKAPNPIATAKHREYLERMSGQLRRFGSERLRASLDRYQGEMLCMLATPLAAQAAVAPVEVRA
jgi:hypothetical protein